MFGRGPYFYGDTVISFDRSLNFLKWETRIKDLQVGIYEGTNIVAVVFFFGKGHPVIVFEVQ